MVIPGEGPINLPAAINGIRSVDDIRLIDAMPCTMRTVELLADQGRATGTTHRHIWVWPAPTSREFPVWRHFYGTERLGF